MGSNGEVLLGELWCVFDYERLPHRLEVLQCVSRDFFILASAMPSMMLNMLKVREGFWIEGRKLRCLRTEILREWPLSCIHHVPRF